MKEYKTDVGSTQSDAMFLYSGFTVSMNDDDDRAYRNCHKEFVFKTFTPNKGAVELTLDMLFEDTHQVVQVMVDDIQIGEIDKIFDGWYNYTICFNMDNIRTDNDYLSIQCMLKNDPFYPPNQAVKICSIKIECKENQELIIVEDMIKDKIQQYPIKLSNCHRTYHEIRKLAPTYRCKADQFKYSSQKKIYFGDVHVHTEYSFCGAPFNGSMEQNLIWAKENNLDFICFADHAEGMDTKTFEEYFNKCRQLSNKYGVLVLPCIE